MKIFSAEEIKSSKADELAKDIIRTKTIKEAKESAEKELNQINSSFEVALANQRIRWMIEEKEATDKIANLQKEIVDLTERKNNIPISSSEEKEYNMTNILTDKLDDLSTREADLAERETKLKIREKACEEERELIKQSQKKISETLININK